MSHESYSLGFAIHLLNYHLNHCNAIHEPLISQIMKNIDGELLLGSKDSIMKHILYSGNMEAKVFT